MEKVQSRLLIITKEMVSFFAKDRAINAVVALFIYLYIYIYYSFCSVELIPLLTLKLSTLQTCIKSAV
jgi:hypothetical protein